MSVHPRSINITQGPEHNFVLALTALEAATSSAVKDDCGFVTQGSIIDLLKI